MATRVKERPFHLTNCRTPSSSVLFLYCLSWCFHGRYQCLLRGIERSSECSWHLCFLPIWMPLWAPGNAEFHCSVCLVVWPRYHRRRPIVVIEKRTAHTVTEKCRYYAAPKRLVKSHSFHWLARQPRWRLSSHYYSGKGSLKVHDLPANHARSLRWRLSLIVAFIFNPVFAVSFHEAGGQGIWWTQNELFRKWWFWFFIIMASLLNLAGWQGGQFLIFGHGTGRTQPLCVPRHHT